MGNELDHASLVHFDELNVICDWIVLYELCACVLGE